MRGRRIGIDILSDDDGDDPILSVVNIVDVFLVVIAVLLIAVMENPLNPFATQDVVVLRNPGEPDMSMPRKALKTLGGENTQQQVAGLKEIIRTSNLLSEKTQNRQSYVLLNQPTEIDHEFPLYVRLGLGEYTHPVTLYFDLAQYLHDKDLNQVKYRFFTQDEWKAHFRKIRDNLLDGNIPLTMTKPEKRVDYDFDFDI